MLVFLGGVLMAFLEVLYYSMGCRENEEMRVLWLLCLSF